MTMIGRSILLAALTSCALGFSVPSSTAAPRGGSSLAALDFDEPETGSFDPLGLSDSEDSPRPRDAGRAAVAIAAASLLASPLPSHAAGPDWGVFEGRTGSLLHPVAMLGAAALSASTALLGFQWRRQRTMGEEISSLRKSLPKLGGAKTVTAALAAAEGAEEVDAAHVASLRAALPIEGQINELTRERKELASAGPRDRHFSQGSALLLLGVAFAIEGPLNTYARAGKLFPGPHLYAGAGLVVLWAAAASVVPAMQKGSDVARTVHIGANVAALGLFAWQVTTGIPILLKVVELTKWP